MTKKLGRSYNGYMSTQQILGLILTELSRSFKHLSERIVTISPDVASSTNMGGWINRAGVWSKRSREEYPGDRERSVIRWDESEKGKHLELGISENNLFMMLGQSGLSYEMTGEMLFPIGTLYDPFIRRGLDSLLYSVSAGGRFIVVGTPSGVTLGPEGGSHQSGMTPSIGVELPELAFYEPCFGQELEWILLSALENIRARKESTYLRLTTKNVDQGLFTLPKDSDAREVLRTQVIRGAYRLVDHRKDDGYDLGVNVVNIFASGAVVPEAVKASNKLLDEGIYANVINVTGPGPLYAEYQETAHAAVRVKPVTVPFLQGVLDGQERRAPIVTVVDGHPHTLAWLGAALNAPTYPLGVTRFGQSGNPDDLYREYEIDSYSIIAAGFAALGM